MLKNQCNILIDENVKLKTKICYLEKEIGRLDGAIEEIMSNKEFINKN